MDLRNKSSTLWKDFLKLRMPQMHAFHMSWFALFAWFGIGPLMKVDREEFLLTKDQIGWCIIGSVAVTVIARMLIGWLCDRIGPRLAYTGLLLLGSIPVMAIGFATDYTSFLLFRVAIGVIGASLVITRYHTSPMFAPNVVGTANATSAVWGNLGGGVTQLTVPLVFGFFVAAIGLSEQASWRASMFVAGVVLALTGVAYYRVQVICMAGLIASLFGLTNIFARTLGGVFGDKFGEMWGFRAESSVCSSCCFAKDWR